MLMQPVYEWDELYRCWRVAAWSYTAANTVVVNAQVNIQINWAVPAMRAEDV